ncbi:GntR family transcriptional regulator [Streptomyces sp. SCSIO 75703]|uniref:GntR family transcriptional regulator n=1 Tax=unclassified Streptomyces TaxID=2593676 RepID=UPI0004C18456|nr:MULTISPECIES: GntR family transcriptional regulator [unclassified Streptomyces]
MLRSGRTVEEIYGELRERILDGVYPPGIRLSQQTLADELSVSRTPLREALHRLEADGLVVAEANRGMTVSPAHHEQAEQSYAARLLIEPPLVAALVGEITEKDIEVMADALEEMERVSARTKDFQKAHLRFHTILLHRYPPLLADMTTQQHSRIVRHQRLHMSRPTVPDDFTRIDRQFLEAVRDGDGARARQLLELHLIDAALGMALDIDPDYRFDSLLIATRGLGLELEHAADGSVSRPVRLTWQRPGAVPMPHTVTSNLEHHSAT